MKKRMKTMTSLPSEKCLIRIKVQRVVEELDRLRREEGWTLGELAELAGMTLATMHRVCSARTVRIGWIQLVIGAARGLEDITHVPLADIKMRLLRKASNPRRQTTPLCGLRPEPRSKYYGVHYDPRDGKYRAYLKVNGAYKNLGSYRTDDEAGQAVIRAVAELKGGATAPPTKVIEMDDCVGMI